MKRKEFEEVVRASLDELPAWAIPLLTNVVVLVEDEDPAEPDLYGIYDGIPLTERYGGDPVEPAHVTVFRTPLVTDFGHDPAVLRAEIRKTILHELAHHFGMDEDRLDELGYG